MPPPPVKRMVLVDSRDRPPINNILDILEDDMRRILASTKSNREKVRHFDQLLLKYSQYRSGGHTLHRPSPKSANVSISTGPVSSSSIGIGGIENPLDELLDRAAVPNSYRTRAKRILTKLQKSGKYDWNVHGHFMEDGEVIPNTNIGELIKFAVSNSKSKNYPDTYKDFFKAMKWSGVPRSYVASHKRKAYDGDAEDTQWGTGGAKLVKGRRKRGLLVRRWERLKI